MLDHALTHRQHPSSSAVSCNGGHVRQRRRWRADDVLEDPFAAEHRRFGWHTTSRSTRFRDPECRRARCCRKRHASEAAATRWECRSVAPGARSRTCSRAQQIEDAAIFLDDALEQQLGLSPKRLAKVVVEVGELPGVRTYAARFRRYSHWPAKLVTSADARGSASIRLTCRCSVAG